MPAFTLPPEYPGAIGRYHIRRDPAILFLIPACADPRMQRCQVIKARQHLFMLTVWASGAAASGRRRSLPAVAFATFPPDPDPARPADVLRPDRVFPVIPFF